MPDWESSLRTHVRRCFCDTCTRVAITDIFYNRLARFCWEATAGSMPRGKLDISEGAKEVDSAVRGGPTETLPPPPLLYYLESLIQCIVIRLLGDVLLTGYST
ncbi:hypothetical protein Tco_0656061 [Tanacetum coccineum]|uniref:Uncharacterized protein n=1 Tax=Tanacetum coccineum TaxID=301880 RepID=A0ABQ4X7Q8_9ASTR